MAEAEAASVDSDIGKAEGRINYWVRVKNKEYRKKAAKKGFLKRQLCFVPEVFAEQKRAYDQAD